MSTKTCKKCGWVYPATYPEKACKFCKTPFTEGYCSICKEWSEDLVDLFCPKCVDKGKKIRVETTMSKKHQRMYIRKRWYAEQQLDEWLAWTRTIKQPYKTLTEEEWLEACRYFNRCALCNADEITARGFFIPFKLGGRYCKWNVIPLCDKCATRLKTQPNIFISYNRKFRAPGTIKTSDAQLKIVTAYLKSTIKEGDLI